MSNQFLQVLRPTVTTAISHRCSTLPSSMLHPSTEGTMTMKSTCRELGHSLAPLAHSLAPQRFRFARALRCSFVRSLTPELMGKWDFVSEMNASVSCDFGPHCAFPLSSPYAPPSTPPFSAGRIGVVPVVSNCMKSTHSFYRHKSLSHELWSERTSEQMSAAERASEASSAEQANE